MIVLYDYTGRDVVHNTATVFDYVPFIIYLPTQLIGDDDDHDV